MRLKIVVPYKNLRIILKSKQFTSIHLRSIIELRKLISLGDIK